MLQGKKTYLLAILAIVGAWTAYFTGTSDLQTAIGATLAALTAASIRSGIKTEAAKVGLKIVPLLLLALSMTACKGDGFKGEVSFMGATVGFDTRKLSEPVTEPVRGVVAAATDALGITKPEAGTK